MSIFREGVVFTDEKETKSLKRCTNCMYWHEENKWCDRCGFGKQDFEVVNGIMKADAIKPNHYKIGGIEPVDYMKMKMSSEAFKGFLLGNVIKYTSRFEHKNGVEDLEKAKWYLERLIQEHKE